MCCVLLSKGGFSGMLQVESVTFRTLVAFMTLKKQQENECVCGGEDGGKPKALLPSQAAPLAFCQK